MTPPRRPGAASRPRRAPTKPPTARSAWCAARGRSKRYSRPEPAGAGATESQPHRRHRAMTAEDTHGQGRLSGHRDHGVAHVRPAAWRRARTDGVEPHRGEDGAALRKGGDAGRHAGRSRLRQGHPTDQPHRLPGAAERHHRSGGVLEADPLPPIFVDFATIAPAESAADSRAARGQRHRLPARAGERHRQRRRDGQAHHHDLRRQGL